MANKMRDGFLSLVGPAFIERSEVFMIKDLELSGLAPEDVYAEPQDHAPMMRGSEFVNAAYKIPYFSREGEVLTEMWRIRVQYLPRITPQIMKEQKLAKYTQPNAQMLAAAGISTAMPYMLPHGAGQTGLLCEGEKKAAAAFERFKCPVIAIGGCWMWGKDRRVHDDIVWWVGHRELTEVILVADPDVTINREVKRAFGRLRGRLMSACPRVRVKVITLPQKMDDYLVTNRRYRFDDLRGESEVAELEMQLGAEDLVAMYELIPKVTKKDGIVGIIKNLGNANKLLREHEKWKGEIRWNDDDGLIELYGRPIVDKLNAGQIVETFNDHLYMPDANMALISDAIEVVAKENHFSPALEDLMQVTKWDGTERIKDVFGQGRDQNTVEMTKLMFHDYANRIMNPGCFARGMPLLVGPQGVGKTGMATWLAGDSKRVAFLHPSDLKNKTKDVTIKLMNARVAVFDDIDGFTPSEQGLLKSLITQTHTIDRKAYGRFQETFMRRGIMIGTSNHSDIIPHDPTGNTRYLVIEIMEKQNFAWLHEWRGQILAEARWLVDQRYEPLIDWVGMTKEYTATPIHIEKFDEWIEEVRGNEKSYARIRCTNDVYFKLESFWRAKFGDNVRAYNPARWELRDVVTHMRSLGLSTGVKRGSSVGRSVIDGKPIKNVWKVFAGRHRGHTGN